jgi:hypothetical protein
MAGTYGIQSNKQKDKKKRGAVTKLLARLNKHTKAKVTS